MLALDKIIEQHATDTPYLKPHNDHIRHRILYADETKFRDRSSPSDLKMEVAWKVLNGTGKLLVMH
jgi:hypothetical protein